MSCNTCKYWRQKYYKYGECLHDDNQVIFIPYTQIPTGIPIDVFNKYEKPKNRPLTSIDYSCKLYEDNKIIE